MTTAANCGPVATIYALTEPGGEIRYVGVTRKSPADRLTRHLRDCSGDNYRSRWIRTLLARGHHPGLLTIQRVPEDSWAEAERYWIAYFRGCGCRLVNTADGGNGAPGVPVTEATRAKLRAAAMGNRGGAGHVDSPETTARRKAAHIGRVYRGGWKQSPETIARRSASLRGKKRGPLTPEHRAKVGAASRGRLHTPEAKAKIAESIRQHWVERREK